MGIDIDMAGMEMGASCWLSMTRAECIIRINEEIFKGRGPVQSSPSVISS